MTQLVNMVSTAPVSEFKAHLSQYLRSVQNGSEITILDHNRPIAKVVPIKPHLKKNRLEVIPPSKKTFRDIRPKGSVDFDPVEYLLEDREDRLP